MRSSHTVGFAAISFSVYQPPEVDRCETSVVDTGNETERERMSESLFYYKSVLAAV